MSNDLITTVHDLVLESPIGAKAIAQAVGKPYSTLLREVNPYDTGAKLGAETLMHIMKTTGNVTPLEKMALEMGYRLEPAEGMGSTPRCAPNPVGRILDLYSAAGGRLRAALPKDSKGLERFLNGVDNASGR